MGYYPDLAIYGTDETHLLDPDTRINPRLIVEVTSKSTESKDRGVKLEDYLLVPTLETYVIVSHVRHEVELWTRASGTWARSLVTEGSLRFAGGAVLQIERLYAELPPAP